MSPKLLVSSILAAFLAIGCAADNTSQSNAAGESLESRPISDVAADHDGLLTLVGALDAADLLDTLASDGPFTVFAPTDEAFAKVPKEALDALLADPEALRDLLLYHVVADELTAEEVLAADSLTSVQGAPITVQAEALTLNDSANIIKTDIIAENGVIHLIDMVLMPLDEEMDDDDEDSDSDEDSDDEGMDDDDEMAPQDIVEIASSDERFETLVTALGIAGLVETLQGEGPFTVFAPTDEAFGKLPAETLEALVADPDALREILLYHVVPGDLRAADVLASEALTTAQGDDIIVDAENLTLNGNTGFVQTDIVADNGVIHAIDMVLLPPEPEPTTIVDIAVSDERFETLVIALGVADLVETLQGEGPFTVFAPTDEAFGKLPAETLDALIADPDALREILLYHVVPGDLRAADVLASEALTTAQGDVIIVDAENLTLNGNTGFVETDIVADNGVIHAIDMVLLPPEPKTIVDIAVEDGRFETLVRALQTAHLVEALEGEGPFTVFAPTDEAFDKLPKSVLNALFHAPSSLRALLLYHVVPGDLAASDVLAMEALETLQGSTISVDADHPSLNGDVGFVQTDIFASNGVIHVIDSVLIPPVH